MPFEHVHIIAKIDQASTVISSLKAQAETIAAICSTVRVCLRNGGQVLTCGNGGSAAEAMHLSEELIGRFRGDREPYAALCLNADPTALTCIANDYGFEQVFARQVRALAQEGDVLVAFSTSGNSPNILRAMREARARKAAVIGLLGKGGGAAAELCDLVLVVNSDETEHIQEAHQVLLHLMLEAVERS
ncbi:MAG: SIS domain-containing protein [Phycisphaerales bacterium]